MKPTPNTRNGSFEYKKERPDHGAEIIFQSHKMHPCRGLAFWFWWHDQVFDIRTIRRELGVITDGRIDVDRTQVSFEAIMRPIIDAVGDRDFAEVIATAERKEEERERSSASI